MIKLPLQRYGIPTTGAILISNHSQTMNIVSTLNEKLLRQNFDDEHSEALLWEECRQTALAYVRTENALAVLMPNFRFVEEHSLTQGMAQFVPIYKVLDRIPAIRNISNKIITLKKV